MPGRLPTGARRRLRWVPVALALAVGGCTTAGPSVVTTALTHEAPRALPSFPAAPTGAAAAPAPAAVQMPNPARVVVSRLGISAAMQPLHLGPAGELVPPSYGSAGWYANGPEPGEAGRAVIAGHVDSTSGPDVFANLRSARPGDRITVELVDGTEQHFTVDDIGLYEKSAFPTDQVYGTSTEPELRLITCGGTYDRSRGGYQSNVVVFAHHTD